MNTKIIFFDIDGTILNQENSLISDSTKAAIKEAQANGHLAMINTGRTLGEMESKITDMGFDGYICGCGTYITYRDSILLHQTIPSSILSTVVKDLDTYKLEAVFEGHTFTYFDTEVTTPFISTIKEDQIRRQIAPIKSLHDPLMTADKFCISPLLNGDFHGFYEKRKDTFDFIDRGNDLYEVVPTGYSKATGMKFILDYLSIPHENTYAIGDSTNDLSMLNYSKHSIAMGNSCQEVLDAASYITTNVEDNGIENALKHFRLI